jgi:caa(3)-type oxidase subunit IV
MNDHALATAAPPDAGHEAAPAADHRKDYIRIFVALVVLTLMEVSLTYLRMDRRIMTVLMIGLALTKASLVGLYFMHLRYEKRLLLWVAALPMPLAGGYALFLLLDSNHLFRAVTLPWVHH